MDQPTFETKQERIDWVVKNNEKIIASKKAAIKHADGVPFVGLGRANKTGGVSTDSDKMQIKAIINTTNVMDSHKDVHIPGIWTKSLKEKKNLMLFQEHKTSEFDKIISDEVKATAENMSFKELGFPALKGDTQALMFDAELNKEDNPMMFAKYAKGKVTNHSVGMQYVKLALAVDSDDYPSEKAVWDKYIDQVANRKEAESNGYFYAVTEAKVIEGSAVPMGSNPFTPTHSAESKDIEPSNDTHKSEPSDDTPTSKRKFFY